MTEHDKKQDAQIAANAEAIRRQTEYLHDIRNHFIPEEEARMKRFAKYVVTPIVKVVALIAFIGGMWDVLAWVYSRYEVKTMADRYLSVAKEVFYGENNPEVATGFLDKAIELRDGDVEYRYQRAYIEGMGAVRLLLNLDRPFTKDELDRAHHAYAEAKFLETLKPTRVEPYILQAQVLLALKEVDRAEKLLDRTLELDPGHEFVHLRRAQLLMDFRHDAKGAEQELACVEAINPKSKWLWLWKGVLANDFKKTPEDARKFYEKALEIDSKFDLAWNNIGWTWMTGAKKDYAKAREAFLKALAVNPAYKEACYAIGMSYGYEDNYPVAKMWLDKAIALDGRFLTAYKWRGIVRGEMADNEGALADFDAALALDAMNADLYVRRAKVYSRLDRGTEALRDLRFAIDLAPNVKRPYLYLGDLQAKMGNTSAALKVYDQAISIDPSYDDAHAAKAKVLAEMGRTQDALLSIDKAIEVCKYKPARFWIVRGDLLTRVGNGKDAVSAYAKARTLQPKLATAWLNESRAAESVGDCDTARLALKAYLELCPTDEEARRRLANLK